MNCARAIATMRIMKASPLLLALLMLACAHGFRSGIMTGHWTPKGGEAERVPLSWESHESGHGKIHATLGRGGEHFSGEYVLVHEGASAVMVHSMYRDWNAPAWGTLDWGDEGNYGASEVVDIHGFAHRYSGRVVATLFGDRDHSMRCKFTLVDPDAGMVGGGVGSCQVSDGGQLDVQF